MPVLRHRYHHDLSIDGAPVRDSANRWEYIGDSAGDAGPGRLALYFVRSMLSVPTAVADLTTDPFELHLAQHDDTLKHSLSVRDVEHKVTPGLPDRLTVTVTLDRIDTYKAGLSLATARVPMSPPRPVPYETAPYAPGTHDGELDRLTRDEEYYVKTGLGTWTKVRLINAYRADNGAPMAAYRIAATPSPVILSFAWMLRSVPADQRHARRDPN